LAKLYKIQEGDLVFFLGKRYNGVSFDIQGFKVKGDGTYYALHGKDGVNLESYLLSKFQALADKELADYFNSNINDMKMYEPVHIDAIWGNAGEKPYTPFVTDIVCNKLMKGIAGLAVNSTVCLYDFVAKTTAGFLDRYSNTSMDTTLLKVFYGRYLKCLLAFEQYNRGVSHPVYNEFVRLREFLKGKKSVKLVIEDGVVHEYKMHTASITPRSLIYLEESGTPCYFMLNNGYYLRPGFDKACSIQELDYIGYGRERYRIDKAIFANYEKDYNNKTTA
jgi:hypothetical protein